jgi:hypothetical protein
LFFVLGETMFGIEKQLDRIVETLALSALMANNPNKKVEKRLREIAFPLEIELEEIGYCGCDFCIANKKEGRKYDMHVTELK